MRWRRTEFNRALLKLDALYARIQLKDKATPDDAVEGTKRFMLAHALSADFYYLVIGLTVLAFTMRGFSEPGIDYGPWRPVVIGLAGILAGVIPLLMTALLFPLHIMFRLNLWMLTGANIVASAVLFSLIEPVIPTYFYSEGILYFEDLFIKILAFYTFALGYLQLRVSDKVCLNTYSKLHKKPAIDQHIPVDKRGALIALTAQDHYVKIITENGEHLNRMSMKDAVGLVRNAQGMQVHRSHWVAFTAMLALNKSAERYFLKLKSGYEVPVSKSKVEAVQAALEQR